ncbi:hypothetical protein FAD_1434 [Ferroplasma acidiphilum]|jgi:hypothetical protein|uniref:Multipass membrane protein n=1 Tax=Ferroplasma acidiphilum TaxID=74969 RepID=A0A1V0N583_9ARCH|nr:hypothetical protein [Ferroplasma acidiphilum]ARD85292.1 hypothetical protein FAD_1434 [Ferroplasma acidiphilum]
MVKKKVIVGIVLIVIGISLVIGGVATITGEPSDHTVKEYSSNVYTSTQFNFSTNRVLLMVTSDNSSAGLVNCSNIQEHASSFNSSNIHNYTVAPAKYVDGEPYYANLNGTYKYVVVTDKAPTMDYNFVTSSELARVTDASYVAAAGALLTGSGIIIAMVTILFGKINARK